MYVRKPISLGRVYRELCINYAKKEYPHYNRISISDEANECDIIINIEKGKYLYENDIYTYYLLTALL